MPDALMTTDLPFPKASGKVRDVYDLDAVLPGHVLIVATDRVSAFDVVLPTGIPGKGELLTQIALFWFARFGHVDNHLVTGDVDAMPGEVRAHAAVLGGRSMLVKKLDIIPFECVARGYLAGSGWSDYQATGAVCGHRLVPGLRNGDQLPAPIFTPATKAQTGHDENVTFEQMAGALGEAMAGELRQKTLDLYRLASEHAEACGILLADTKLEWGVDPVTGRLVLADEIFTPDSSRFWPADAWKPGGVQPSFDKQFVRDYLATLSWDKTPPGPALPQSVIAGTLDRYRDAFARLTGR